MLEKIFGKKAINTEAPKKEETVEEQTKREEQEYYERNKELLNTAKEKIAKKIIEKMKKPKGVRGNTFLTSISEDERELAKEIISDVVGVKKLVDRYGDSEKIKDQEIFPYLETDLKKVADSENKWESRLNLAYRKVKEEGKRERIDGSSVMLGDIREFIDQEQAEDYLQIRKMVAREAFNEFEGGHIEEPPREE